MNMNGLCSDCIYDCLCQIDKDVRYPDGLIRNKNLPVYPFNTVIECPDYLPKPSEDNA